MTLKESFINKMDIREIESIIEGLLFAYGEPLSLDKICQVLEMDKKTTKSILANMVMKYQESKRGILIREIGNGFQLCTRHEHYEFIKKLFKPRQKQGLSQAALETLAIIAYNSNVTRAKVEKIRGVNSDSSITRLIERSLIKETGRLDVPGRPIIYEITDEFFRSFGYRSKADLPRIEMNELQLDETLVD